MDAATYIFAAHLLAGPGEHEAQTTDPLDPRRIVVVTGTQTERSIEDSPIKVDVVDREDIESSGAENVAEALEHEPGVRVVPGIGGSGIRMMGLDPKYTVVLIDGQRVTGLVNGQIDLRRLPVDAVERIEIVRGGGSVLYGSDAVAGVVNIITRRADPKNEPVEAEARFSYGSFDTIDGSARLGTGRPRWHGSVHGGYRSTSGWDRNPQAPERSGDAIAQFNVGGAAGLGRWGPFRIDAAVDYLQRDRTGVDANASGAVIDRRNLTQTLQARLTPEVSGPNGRLRIIASYSAFDDQFVQDQRGDDDLDKDERTEDQIAQVRAQYDLPIRSRRAGFHTLSVGTEGQFEFLEGARLDPTLVDRQRFAMYVQDEWSVGTVPMVSVLPGVRVDYDSYFDAWLTPRIALMLRPSDQFDARVNYGRAYRAPAFKEMFLAFDNLGAGYIVRGNPDLRPEDAWGTTVDLSYRPAAWMEFQGSVFETRLSNAIVADAASEANPGEPTPFGYVNVGNARTQGAELRLRFDVLGSASLGGSYQALATRDLDQDRPLPGRARHSGTFDLEVRHRHARWGTTARIRGAAFGSRVYYRDLDGDGDTERDVDPPFVTIDLRLGQTLFEYVEVFVGIDNLLDAGNATTNPLIPRSYYGGISVHY